MDQLTSEVRPFYQLEVVKLIARAFFICLLVIPLTLNLPRVIHFAHADTDWSHLEDCNGDGLDDTTGVQLPWVGFDGTRGDTDKGPGTAAWWIAQNAGAKASSGSSSGSGSSSSNSGSTDSGTDSSSGSTSAKATSSSWGSGSTAAKKATSTGTTSAKAAGTAATATSAVASAAAAPGAASATATTTPTSVATTACPLHAAAASGTPLAAGATSDNGGPAGGSTSLWDALTVGFTSQNKELYAGLGLLAALALAGGLALGVGALRDIASYARLRRSESAPTEEPVASTA